MDDADLYIARIGIARYFTEEQCRNCGAASCRELVEQLRRGGRRPADLDFLTTNRAAAVNAALRAEQIMPAVPMLQLPSPGPTGLTELNNPGPDDAVLVTGNSELTQQVLLAVMSKGLTPAYVLFVDTRGDTLDMAVILETFTARAVKTALDPELRSGRLKDNMLIIPGLAASLADDVRTATGRTVKVGPVCAAELPLMLGDRWIPA